MLLYLYNNDNYICPKPIKSICFLNYIRIYFDVDYDAVAYIDKS